MGGLSIWHWLIVGVIVLMLFGGKGKISDIMGDFAKGIKSFKKGLTDEDDDKTGKPDDKNKTLDHAAGSPLAEAKTAETHKVG
jgi:sec-independent protein translocase protein TatA